ncbi:unnamed protein product [Absidia cylindrospora]
MVSLCWRDCIITLLLITSTIQAIPIASSSIPNESTTHQDDIKISFRRLAQHVSSHLLFEHVDPLVYQLSQHIASVFRTSMTLQRRPFFYNNDDHANRMIIQPTEDHVDHDVIPVDMDILLGQLQGAVGSFLEDKLPGIWNRQLTGLDRTMMQTKIEHYLLSHCPDQSYSCMQHSTAGGVNLLQQIVQVGDQTIQADLTQAWLSILQNDLPYLFNAAKTQVNGVLTLFDPPEHQDYQLQWDIDWPEMQILFMDHWTTLTSKLLCHPSDHPVKLHWIHYSKQS